MSKPRFNIGDEIIYTDPFGMEYPGTVRYHYPRDRRPYDVRVQIDGRGDRWTVYSAYAKQLRPAFNPQDIVIEDWS